MENGELLRVLEPQAEPGGGPGTLPSNTSCGWVQSGVMTASQSGHCPGRERRGPR